MCDHFGSFTHWSQHKHIHIHNIDCKCYFQMTCACPAYMYFGARCPVLSNRRAKKHTQNEKCALIPFGHKVATGTERGSGMKRKKMTKINDLKKLFPAHFSKWHISEFVWTVFRLLFSPALVTLIIFFYSFCSQSEHAGQNTWYLLDTDTNRKKMEIERNIVCLWTCKF